MDKGQLRSSVKSSILLGCIFFGIIFSQVFANSMLSDSNKKKAGVLYNLSKFIDWPKQTFSSKNSPFNICLIGEVVFLDALKTFEKRQIRGRAVRIHVLQKNLANSTKKQTIWFSDCQTIYIDSSAQESLPNILALLDKKPILTISYLPDFILQGGMIKLIQVKKRVRFAINLDAAKSVDLAISAQLLRLAKSVKYKNTQIDNP